MILIRLDNDLDEWRLETQMMNPLIDDDASVLTSADLDIADSYIADTEKDETVSDYDHHDTCDDYTDEDDYTTLYI